MKYTEEQLKAALVRALPEKLTVYPFTRFAAWIPDSSLKTGYLVTPREWSEIVGMVEDKLTDEQRERYSLKLCLNIHKNQYVSLMNHRELFDVITAKWQVKAQTFADIGAIVVDQP